MIFYCILFQSNYFCYIIFNSLCIYKLYIYLKLVTTISLLNYIELQVTCVFCVCFFIIMGFDTFSL